MTLVPVIIDVKVSYPRFAAGPVSLLTLPLGTSSVLSYLVSRMSGLGHEEILVVPSFVANPAYEDRIRTMAGPTARVVSSDELGVFLSDCEIADYLLVIEPRHWPVGGFELSKVKRHLHTYQGATHLISIGAAQASMRELVECDVDSQVKRVQRFYNEINWPEAATRTLTYSLVPARAAADVRFNSLVALRSALAANGMLSRDLPLASEVEDLANENGFLAVHERVLDDTLSQDTPAGFKMTKPGVLVGSGCRIHPSARLVAPIIIQPGSTIEEGAMLVGPTLIGSGSQVGREAAIAQGVLLPQTVVAAGVTIRQEVVTGRCRDTSRVDDRTGRKATLEVQGSMSGGQRAEPCMASPIASKTLRRRIQLGVKRLLDVVLSSVALLLLSPLLVVLAILIKLDSRGPVFFIHHRERKGGGKDFPCLKFRTMAVGAHTQQRGLYAQSEVNGPQFKMRHDPRVTRLGHWLRASNLDELPQLTNVLLGHMSLVGPRPSPFRENQICVPWRQARLSVRPGITGLWQLCRSGHSEQGFDQWIYYDIMYVRRFSIWLDLKIVLATAFSLGGRLDVPLSWLIPTTGRDSVYFSGSTQDNLSTGS